MKQIKRLLPLFLLSTILFGCSKGNDSSSKPSNNLPANLREGYTQKYDGFSSKVHNVTSKESGARIYGRLFEADGFDATKKYPTLIMSHGYNSVSMDGTNGIVMGAISKGMLVYTFDFRGGGKMTQSVGKTTDMTVKTEINDLESVLDDIRSLPFVDTSKVALFGHSFGGLVTAMTAGLHPDVASAIVLHAPALSLGLDSPYSSREEIENLPDEPIFMNNMNVSKQFYLDLWDIDVNDTIVKWAKDVYITVGDQDGFVEPVKEEAQYYTDHGCPTTLNVLEGAEHSYTTDEYNAVLPEIYDYLIKMNILAE